MAAARVDLRGYVVISLWFGCNNDCSLCMLKGMRESLPPIGFDRFREVLAEIRKQGILRNLILSGAEVTTCGDLFRHIEFAASLGWFEKIQIQTNGRKLADRDYMRALTDRGVNEFFVSVQGTEAVHDRITGRPGSYRETMKGLHNLAGLGVNVISNTVMTGDNCHDLENLMAALAPEDISEFHLWNFFPMRAGDREDLTVDLGRIVPLIPRLRAALGPEERPLVLKSFPHCLPVVPGVAFDSWFPVTVLPTAFWKEFVGNRFRECPHQDRCADKSCWGISNAYLARFGDERLRLKPFLTQPEGHDHG